MALYDNKYWLLSHIRNSFITTDDTGLCELVMMGDTKDIKKHILSQETYSEPEGSEDDEDELEPQSYDIETEFEFGRERSNTAVQLEKFENKKKLHRIKHIKWEMDKSLPENYFDDLFVKRDVRGIKVETKTSMVSEVIQKYTNLPVNPFIDYAKFDGSGQVNIPTRKYKIFLTMLPESLSNYPIGICCIASAKVEELIGLILLQLSLNHPDVPIKSTNHYGLYITEEDGEVDSDFPCLSAKECIAKFSFNCLGLVEHKDTRTVTFDNSVMIAGNSHENNLRKKAIRDSKLEEKRKLQNMKLIDVHNKAMEAPLYQSYRVYKMLNRVRGKVEIHLGISGEKIEIDPIQQKNSKFPNLSKQKAISHHMDTIAWCEITDVKNSKTCFKIVYSLTFGGSVPNTADNSFGSYSFSPVLQTSASFKHYEFETDNSTALDIVQKINSILELRSSSSRKEYIAAKERKNYKRKSFNLSKK
ncbi:unnamed protein product [Brassicogethes aeneus]|uniref:Target of rapamycin complex 2 subunit MAPKAP1 n=1 Tax=Brassicogethes aeneus TaxID=1431903 RepID=A0A9P0BAT3_BRAAE|nr:unnamed protein product [Brassicogethes aeneus]